MPYYFLQPDYDQLWAQVDDLRDRIRQAKEVAAESTEQSSETWHDNYDFEEHQRQIMMLSQYLESLVKILNEAEVVAGIVGDEVGLGSRVTVEDLATGQMFTYFIGSYMCLGDDIGYISYISPIASVLFGAKAGEVKSGLVGSTEKTYRLISIDNLGKSTDIRPNQSEEEKGE
ncbi:GreA/GreB family elongation factor [Patescibacteria group bacterium]|nr:GreA/GreB family elongation factor [Patescibacteria group bacterium]MBU1028806.1 GreA/GreB family elongation factor [Patescibacteria group bacterium]MBU1915837.1 GreA/GreB family elongation factor [Patescibacteria group bacterium]